MNRFHNNTIRLREKVGIYELRSTNMITLVKCVAPSQKDPSCQNG